MGISVKDLSNTGNPWSSVNDKFGALYFEYQNKTGYDTKINSLSIRIGVGNGTVKDSSTGSTVKAIGASAITYLQYTKNKTTYRSNDVTVNTVMNKVTNCNYFSQPQTTYVYYFNNPVVIKNNESVEIYVYKRSGGVICMSKSTAFVSIDESYDSCSEAVFTVSPSNNIFVNDIVKLSLSDVDTKYDTKLQVSYDGKVWTDILSSKGSSSYSQNYQAKSYDSRPPIIYFRAVCTYQNYRPWSQTIEVPLSYIKGKCISPTISTGNRLTIGRDLEFSVNPNSNTCSTRILVKAHNRGESVTSVQTILDETYTVVNPNEYLIPVESVNQRSTSVNDIKWVQSILNRLGYYNDTINGVFNTTTRESVERFQIEHNLSQDGSVGSVTRDAMLKDWEDVMNLPTRFSYNKKINYMNYIGPDSKLVISAINSEYGCIDSEQTSEVILIYSPTNMYETTQDYQGFKYKVSVDGIDMINNTTSTIKLYDDDRRLSVNLSTFPTSLNNGNFNKLGIFLYDLDGNLIREGYRDNDPETDSDFNITIPSDAENLSKYYIILKFMNSITVEDVEYLSCDERYSIRTADFMFVKRFSDQPSIVVPDYPNKEVRDFTIYNKKFYIVISIPRDPQNSNILDIEVKIGNKKYTYINHKSNFLKIVSFSGITRTDLGAGGVYVTFDSRQVYDGSEVTVSCYSDYSYANMENPITIKYEEPPKQVKFDTPVLYQDQVTFLNALHNHFNCYMGIYNRINPRNDMDSIDWSPKETLQVDFYQRILKAYKNIGTVLGAFGYDSQFISYLDVELLVPGTIVKGNIISPRPSWSWTVSSVSAINCYNDLIYIMSDIM